MNKKSIFVSTAIPYVNAAPHLGHAIEFVQADVVARYQRAMGNDVFFLSGTDDNALKNVLKAEEAGQDVASFVEKNAAAFQKLLADLDVSNDDFIRTSSDQRHAPGAQKLWQAFRKEDIERKSYKGLYCVGCEEFKTEKELTDGRCPEHPDAELEEIEEENWFFKLGSYTDRLQNIITSGGLRIVPDVRKNEVLAFIRRGLEDLSISRSAERARGWGVPVPGDPTQIQYVWVDALSNYITALDYAHAGAQFKKYWEGSDERIHVIGKGISRFHAIYWPAFLLSAGVQLPTTLFVHGYVTVGGQKMSKSLGNIVDPSPVIKEYGVDAFRYFVARHIHPFEDSDFTMERFKQAYNADLANGLGNLVARVMQLSQSNLERSVDVTFVPYPSEFTKALDSFKPNEALEYVAARVQALDQKINQTEPFKVVKTDPERGKKLIEELVRELAAIDLMLEPFIPKTSKAIIDAIVANTKPANLFPRKE
ncbi:methionine--tRNA ligase [Candidatus Kaiserbacteria bacterium]|nr:methionine--tRNA ligase [Candidatus Kaiserbacteria bacterium]